MTASIKIPVWFYQAVIPSIVLAALAWVFLGISGHSTQLAAMEQKQENFEKWATEANEQQREFNNRLLQIYERQLGLPTPVPSPTGGAS